MNAWRALVALIVAGVLSGCGYNTIQQKDEAVKSAWAEVLSQYQRRADLIPNIVNTVKGEANFEQTTLQNVIEARARATSIQATPEFALMLMNISHALTTYWWMTLAGVIAFLLVFRAFVRTKFGKRLYDRFKLKMPVFGKLNHRIALARFSRTLGTLLVSGVPILRALETVAGAIDNEIISDAVMEARARIREGDRIRARGPSRDSGVEAETLEVLP